MCKHYGIDNSRRTLHGALLDSEILAEVYLELIGGKQVSLALIAENRISGADAIASRVVARPRSNPLPPRISAEELAAHVAFVSKLGEDAIWAQYADPISTTAE
jgi:DNA polymerase-3 subunit epsilon